MKKLTQNNFKGVEKEVIKSRLNFLRIHKSLKPENITDEDVKWDMKIAMNTGTGNRLNVLSKYKEYIIKAEQERIINILRSDLYLQAHRTTIERIVKEIKEEQGK